MAQQQNGPPIKFQSILELPSIGINNEAIKFGNITFESDRCLVVRELNKISIVNTSDKNVTPLNVKVDSSIMNPKSNVIGLRAKNVLQIFNLDMKTKMKSYELENENILFWKWLNPNTIAFVTDKSVYHWSMDVNEQIPKKKLDVLFSNKNTTQIVNYDSSQDGKWLFLQAIVRNEETNKMDGLLQLYSVEQDKYQPKMNAHGACFAHLTIDKRNVTLFCFTKDKKLFIIEIGNNDNDKENSLKVQADVPMINENDFVLSMIASEKYHCLYGVTQKGSLFIFDIKSGKCIVQHTFPNTLFFKAISHSKSSGIMTVDNKGRVCLFHIDEQRYVSYIKDTLGDTQCAIEIAIDTGLQGVNDTFKQQFKQFMQQGQYQQAVKIAVKAPGGILRTAQTIEALERAQVVGGNQPTPMDLRYYQLLLKNNMVLNEIESLGLCQRIFHLPNVQAAQAIKKIEYYVKEKKLTPSERLGDLLEHHDVKLALTIYTAAKIPYKQGLCLIKLGQADKIVSLSKSVSWQPDWTQWLINVWQIKRDDVKAFSQQLVDESYLTAQQVVNTLLGQGRNDVEKTTEFLLDYLQSRGNRQEDAALQTKLLEINLQHAPQVAVAILQSDEYTFTYFDKEYISRLCENARLFEYALTFYQSLNDIKRVLQLGLTTTNGLKHDFVIKYFGDLTPEDAISCLRDMLQYNNSIRTNTQLIVEISKRYSDFLGMDTLITLFEEFENWSVIYLFLGSKVNTSEDSNVIFKYIEAACQLGQYSQAELICRENDFYDAKQVKDYLIDNSDKIKDPRPLIYVCDRHGFINELTNHLYHNKMYKFIQVYVTKMNQNATPKVVGTLLDLNASKDEIFNLINFVRPPQCPIGELVEEMENRHQLKLLLPWLEARYNEDLKDVELHNALAKIYINNDNNNAKHFLSTNKFYDSKVIGKYCESRDPQLSVIAYKRAFGECDQEFIQVTNKHGLFKQQAKYCVERKDAQLWNIVLDEDNQDRRSLIDQVVGNVLPESRNAEELSVTIQAFMNADLPNELIQLLEKIVLSPSSNDYYNVKKNKNLQNLLILTAIKADHDTTRVSQYIDRLDNYDGPHMAEICINDEYKLYEEAFLIYKKFNCGVEAINVLLKNIKDIERACEFASYCNVPNVWSILGRAQLSVSQIKPAIESFLKAGDAQYYQDVITLANEQNEYEILVSFLQMARGNGNSKVRDRKTIDSELIYAYARIKDLSSLETFITASHCAANIDKIGNRCFEQELFDAAKILFTHNNNYAKLASTLVKLKEFQQAADCCKKANSIETWKDVCFACVDTNKFRLAQMCGLNVIVFVNHIQHVIDHYETGGYFTQLIELFEHGINLERANESIYTQLGILYSKYKQDKLMQHIQLFWSCVNIPTLLQSCKDNLQWKECIILYTHYDQYSNAIDTIIDHSSQCWEHKQFKSIILRVINNQIYYRAINFYLKQHPLLLSELLIELNNKLDHRRVVTTIEHHYHPLIKSYLQHVQKRENINVVNEALNQLYIEEENYDSLKESINNYDSFDAISLALQLSKHDLLEFRRISALLYRNQQRWIKSIELSKNDKLWQDAMDCASLSNDKQLAQDLLKYFILNKECPRSCFSACLFTCNKLIDADIVLELAWKHKLIEDSMPFIIQTVKNLNDKMQMLQEKINVLEQEREKKVQEKESTLQTQAQMLVNAHPLMLAYYGQQQQPQ